MGLWKLQPMIGKLFLRTCPYIRNEEGLNEEEEPLHNGFPRRTLPNVGREQQ
jgi:hypothetical protein